MAISELMADILRMACLSMPKEVGETRADMSWRFGDAVCGETETAWLVRCTHSANPPATEEEIRLAETELGSSLPREYRDLLRQCNGARLFIVPQVWLRESFPEASYVRHHVFGTSELVTVNRNLLVFFREALGNDPDCRDIHKLNYIAFCDAHDGNYEAVLLDEPNQGEIFLLFRELLYRPYDDFDRAWYYRIAKSLEDWLVLLIRTGGWGGNDKMRKVI